VEATLNFVSGGTDLVTLQCSVLLSFLLSFP